MRDSRKIQKYFSDERMMHDVPFKWFPFKFTEHALQVFYKCIVEYFNSMIFFFCISLDNFQFFSYLKFVFKFLFFKK